MPDCNEEFNGLRIHKGTKAFDLMPFAFFPRRARPSLSSLSELFRAKKKLKIYWEPEVAAEVLVNIERSSRLKTADLSILKQEFADRI